MLKDLMRKKDIEVQYQDKNIQNKELKVIYKFMDRKNN